MNPVRTLRHGATLVWRNLVKIKHSPAQILDLTVQPIMFVLIFVFLFGGAIGAGDRHSYLQYVMPGVMAQTAAFGTMIRQWDQRIMVPPEATGSVATPAA